ncbi:hypothetical protein [uncultured Bradyrhizobium sp.]|nr:hypothetical protein [uncultured Bradyrhizobium sp.]
MDKPMRCQCGRTRTIVLDKHFRTALVCLKCDDVEQAAPAKPAEQVLTAP